MFLRTIAGLMLALVSVSATARIGTIDQVPAATLLFPHFEVDTNNSQGVTTLLSIQNASASATMVNLTLWTDYGIPTTNYNIYLTGYDIETLDLADLFVRRYMPRTASAGQDPNDNISNHGPISQDINFASCNGILPEPQASLTSRDLIAAHTGVASVEYLGGQCGGRNYGDGIARGYITVDVTNQCYFGTPADVGYFLSGGGGVAGNRNIIVGDYVIADRQRGRFFAESAVNIEAVFGSPVPPLPGNTSFYGRYLGGATTDGREALPTAWAGRYASARTDLDYWRDSGGSTAPFTCGTTPAQVPIPQRQVAVFNAAGTQVGTPTGNLFPYAAGSTSGAGALALTQPLGWLFVNLNTAPGAVRQSWLTFRQMPRGVPANSPMGYSVPGIQLGNVSGNSDPTP